MTNSVPNPYFLKSMSDAEIRQGILDNRDKILRRAFPGKSVTVSTLDEALDAENVNFQVQKNAILVVNAPLPTVPHAPLDPNATFTYVDPQADPNAKVATVRTDTYQTLGFVGPDYPIVQTGEAMEALDILARRNAVTIVNMRTKNNGAKIQITALLDVSSFPSMDGAPNTIAHFAIFEASHDGNSCNTVSVYSLRLECFNGMTSRRVLKTHKLRHTSRISERTGLMTKDVLTTLLGDVETERALFKSMVNQPMNRRQFDDFVLELLGGELPTDASKARKTRRENAVNELTEYFEGGNQGAGKTVWGAYNSLTRWVEGQKERIADAEKFAKKFDSNFDGANQGKVARGLALLTR